MALKRLNAEHLLAIQYLSLPRKGGKTDEEIAQISGVSRQSIHNWRKDPLFERELKKQIVRNSQDRLPELVESLAEIAIRDGNAAMAKLALQINGMLTDKVEIETKGSDKDIDYDALDSEIASFGATLGKPKDVE
ncbi:phBC6A51 family helix-turn-helix protein [Peribacillus huizhouensis]|uniref:Homeodomain phBC6A51-type domain-containing protein n=1 Tax=Peribacillus huizhouensis TaxID=1501239 RepID=A0ABR6CRF5_9BACI|nr:phBC6A51 family helix-turn-helix protein [Peribacillus huizhouensis]MBA9027534.1 hypothetical protein [Peribacillus huizhouensis]